MKHSNTQNITRQKITRSAVLVTNFLAALMMAAPSTYAADPRSGFSAEVVRESDGTAKVIFQPVTSTDKVSIYNKLGEPIGQLNWSAAFEIKVSEKALRQATTPEGIVVHSLLRGIGTVEAGDKMLVSAELPYTVKDLDGRDLPKGTQVFFGLEGLASQGAVAPVSAWGGTMGPGGAANEFNDRLLTSGVKPLVKKGSPAKVPVKPAAKKSAAKPAETVPSHSHGVHGEGATPLVEDTVREVFESAGIDVSDDKILSSPTCTATSSQSLRMSSYYGKRAGFRTDNGARASRFHDGIDIAGRTGTPIVAAADGCISVQGMRFNRTAGYGITVRMDHAKGISTQYSHMQNFSPEIRAWAKTARKNATYCVARGTPIGTVGATGNCTGPHLHFGVRKDGRSVDPRKFMRAQSNGDLSETCTVLQAKNQLLKPLDEALAALSNKTYRSGGVQTASAKGAAVLQ